MSVVPRFLAIVVAVAAGLGAWFGYERTLAAESPDAAGPSGVVDGEAAMAAPPPWASLELVVADTPWDGPTFVSVEPPDDIGQLSMAFDPASSRTKMTLFDQQGVVSSEVEADVDEVYVRTDGATWETPTADDSFSPAALRGAAYAVPVPTLVDLIPEATWQYAEVLSDTAGGDAATPTRILTIRIYGGAFAAAEPAVAAQWRGNSYFAGQRGLVDLEVEIDAEGHVVGLRNLAPDDNVQYRFEPLDAPPTFAAPFGD